MSKSHTKTMKAVLFEGKPYQMVVKDVPKPKIQEPTDVIVQVTTAAICGSDLHEYHGVLGAPDTPYIMGHEGVGIVHEVGSKVEKLKLGHRVIIPDGFMLNNQYNIYGEGDLFAPDLGGCQAEYVRVPMGDNALFPVPAGTDHELDFVMCSDIFVTGWSSITTTGFQPGDTVAVYGAGPVGLLAAYSAILRGALRVYSIDHVEARLGRAESIGAIPIDLRQGDPSAQILKLEPTGVKRTSDCVGYECVNSKLEPEEGYIINDMVKVTANGGGIAITGVYFHGPKNASEPKQGPKFKSIPFDVSAWWLKNINIGGGLVLDPTLTQTLIDMILAERARPSFIVDHIVRIAEVPDAYRLFSEHKVQKVVIDFRPRVNGKRKHED